MIKVASFTKSGNKAEAQAGLDESVFGVKPNHELISLAYRSYLAAARNANANTLGRGEVRGGGKKPWRQKGTGRARVGSIRVPHWRGGGVVFGPTGEENYEIRLNDKMKRAAIRQALSLKAKEGQIMVLESFTSSEGKVKPTVALIGKMKLEGNILLAVNDKTSLIDRATRNISGLKVVQAMYLNVYDIMNADAIVIDKTSLEIISQWLGEVKPEPTKKPAKAEAAK
jgi:large subunit ribosomal protein L4